MVGLTPFADRLQHTAQGQRVSACRHRLTDPNGMTVTARDLHGRSRQCGVSPPIGWRSPMELLGISFQCCVCLIKMPLIHIGIKNTAFFYLLEISGFTY